MRKPLLSLSFVVIFIIFAFSSPAQEIGVLKVQSLERVFSDIETVARAAGQDFDRETIMGSMLGLMGVEDSTLLDLTRPVAVVLPAEGMMLQQKGLIAAVPVTDVAAALALLEGRFATATSEDDLHTFGTEEGPVLYALARDGYLRVGASSDLVTRFDPLAGEPPKTTIALEIFLEPVTPMIQAGLAAARQELQTGMANDLAGEEVGIDPQAMTSLLDIYFDGVRTLVNNTSSLRLSLEVKGGHILLTESLMPKEDSSLAQFIAAQKGGATEASSWVDPQAAMLMVANITVTDELRQGVKEFTNRYMDIVGTMFDTPETDPAEAAQDGETPNADDQAAEKRPLVPPEVWQSYIASLAPFTERWVDCLRGDMSVSFDLAAAGSFSVIEVIGLNQQETCSSLITDMTSQMQQSIAESSELATMLSISDGPPVGDAASMLMTMNMMQFLKLVDQANNPEAERAMKAIYGEKMEIAMVTYDGYAVVTGGKDASKLLQDVCTGPKRSAASPALKPLQDGLALSAAINLGRFIGGIQGIVGEEAKLGGLEQALSGEVGRIQMGLRLSPAVGASGELAVSLQTIEAIAAFVAEQKAKTAAAEGQ